jgi:hypothetical protein
MSLTLRIVRQVQYIDYNIGVIGVIGECLPNNLIKWHNNLILLKYHRNDQLMALK